MKEKLTVIFFGLVLTISVTAQSDRKKIQNETAVMNQSSIIGTWKGEINHQPAIEVVLRNASGRLAGTAIFYAIKGVGEEPSAGEKIEVALIEPEINGRALFFKFKRPDGAIEKLEMRFVNETEAVIKPLGDDQVPEEMVIKVKKAE